MGRKKGGAKTREEKLARRGRFTHEENTQKREATLQEELTKQAKFEKEVEVQDKNIKTADEYRAYIASLYLPGCLHTLTEDERNSPEMNRYAQVVDRYQTFVGSCTANEQINTFVVFWDNTDNKELVDRNLVRFVLYRAMTFVTCKEQMGANWEEYASNWVSLAINLIGAIKFGSAKVYHTAVDSWAKRRIIPQKEQVGEEQGRFLFALLDVLQKFFESQYLGLLLILDEFAPCNCLTQEAKKEKKKLRRQKYEGARFVCCVCNKREEPPPYHLVCVPCKLCCYCSKECQDKDWREGAEGMNHKFICPIVQEITSLQMMPRPEWSD